MNAVLASLPTWLLPGFILLLSVVALGIILERAWFLYYRPGGISAALEARVRAEMGRGEQGGGVEYSPEQQPAEASLWQHPALAELPTLLATHNADEQMVERAVARVGRAYQRFLPTLGVISTIAPLLGLFGTVTGMIRSFRALDASRLQQQALLGGIDEALITTALGLLTAIPCIVAYNYFAARANAILDTVESLYRRASRSL